MGEEWLSLTAYMKRFHTGFKEVKNMMDNGELEYKRTEGGHYKIKVGGNAVSRDIYEKEKERRIQAETKIKMLKKVLEEEVIRNEED